MPQRLRQVDSSANCPLDSAVDFRQDACIDQLIDQFSILNSQFSIMQTFKLTDKEQRLLDSIRDGMDEPGCGWLHELDPFNNEHVCAGVLGSLITKGLVHSYQDDEFPKCYWLTLL